MKILILLSGLLGALAAPALAQMETGRMEQALIIHLPIAGPAAEWPNQSIDALGEELAKLIIDNNLGEFDGDLRGEGWCLFYMYGTSADRLYEIVRPVVSAHPSSRGGFAIRRYGPADDPNAQEIKTLF